MDEVSEVLGEAIMLLESEEPVILSQGHHERGLVEPASN